MTRSRLLVRVATLALLGALVAPETGFAARFSGIGVLPGGPGYSEAWGVSADGRTVVGESGSAAGSEAVVWRNGRLERLPPADPRLASSGSAHAASADGTVIVGSGGARWEGGVPSALHEPEAGL